jgi:phosphoribosylformylglycinamidine synthase PurS subunit
VAVFGISVSFPAGTGSLARSSYHFSIMFKAEVKIMLRPAILDVQGKTVENSLHSLGYAGVGHVRIGKHITLEIEAPGLEEAERIAREVSERVLSNPVMEDFEVTVSAMEPEEAR